jgi:hypothetical protein
MFGLFSKLEERVRTLEDSLYHEKFKRFDAEPEYIKWDREEAYPMQGYMKTITLYSIAKKDYSSLSYISALSFYDNQGKRDAVFDILTKEEKKNGSVKK